MRVVLLFSMLLMLDTGLFAQSRKFPVLPPKGDLIAFIPGGYDSLEIIRGDLNKDQVDDAVLILKSKEEDGEVVTDSFPPRLLVILFRDGSSYKLAGTSNDAIMCKNCGGAFGDPYAGAQINNNVFSIDFYGGTSWRWTRTFKFRYQEGYFRLIGATRDYYWNVEECEKLGDFAGRNFYDINYITGSFEEKKISNEGCKLLVHKKGKVAKKPLQTLSDFSIDASF